MTDTSGLLEALNMGGVASTLVVLSWFVRANLVRIQRVEAKLDECRADHMDAMTALHQSRDELITEIRRSR